MQLVQVSPRCYAMVHDRNRLCDANSGLVAAGHALLIDTQADLAHAREVLSLAANVIGGGPDYVVNTHEDIDHVAGNQLLPDIPVIAHASLAGRLHEVADPRRLQHLQRVASTGLGRTVLAMLHPGLLGAARSMARYDFSAIELREPSVTFDDRFALDLGGFAAEVIHVGPAHQVADSIVHVPDERVVFAGDVVFQGVLPMGWAGTTDQWLAALDLIESLVPKAIVPGHGPVCGIDAVHDMRAFLERVRRQASAWFDEGLPSPEAAARIDLGPFAGWNGADARIWFSVERVYRERRGDARPLNVVKAFDHAYRVCKARKAPFRI